jgi:hypothetical protein
MIGAPSCDPSGDALDDFVRRSRWNRWSGRDLAATRHQSCKHYFAVD